MTSYEQKKHNWLFEFNGRLDNNYLQVRDIFKWGAMAVPQPYVLNATFDIFLLKSIRVSMATFLVVDCGLLRRGLLIKGQGHNTNHNTQKTWVSHYCKICMFIFYHASNSKAQPCKSGRISLCMECSQCSHSTVSMKWVPLSKITPLQTLWHCIKNALYACMHLT